MISFAVSIFAACSSTSDMVDVREYHLKETQRIDRDNPIVRAEQQKRLRGAVSRSEQRDRLGQYYSVEWSGRGVNGGGVRVEFHYQQAATGHEKLIKVKEYAANDPEGVCEFIFNGEDYRENGRVLCWKVLVYQADELLGSEQSYLWRD